MSSKIEPAFFDRSQALNSDGGYISAEIPYFVFDAEDETAALSFAYANTAAYYAGLPRQTIEIEERINARGCRGEEHRLQGGGDDIPAQGDSG